MAGTHGSFRIEAASSIDAVERDEWDALAAGASVYSSWRWHRALEATHPWEPRYLLARTPSGSPAGALPVFVASEPVNPLYDPPAILDDLPAHRTRWYPGVVAGSRAGYLTDVLVPRGPARVELLRLLCDEINLIAEDRGAEATWLLYAQAEDALDLAAALGPRSLVLLVGGDTELTIEWPDFDGYLGHLSSDRRRAVRREITAFEESGASLSVEGLAGVEHHLAPLLVLVDRKYGHRTTRHEAERYLRAQSEVFGDLARVFVCRRRGSITGFALLYEWSGRLWARAVGFDYDSSARGDYFNTLFYGPIRWAVSRGLEAVHLGIEAFESKLARGCALRPLWGVVAREGVPATTEIAHVRRRNRERVTSLVARYGRLTKASLPAKPVELMTDAGWMATDDA